MQRIIRLHHQKPGDQQNHVAKCKAPCANDPARRTLGVRIVTGSTRAGARGVGRRLAPTSRRRRRRHPPPRVIQRALPAPPRHGRRGLHGRAPWLAAAPSAGSRPRGCGAGRRALCAAARGCCAGQLGEVSRLGQEALVARDKDGRTALGGALAGQAPAPPPRGLAAPGPRGRCAYGGAAFHHTTRTP